jgi:hypothetical protein
MNFPPHRQQVASFARHLLHDPTKVAPPNADNPVETSLQSFQPNLRFAALAEHMHVRRAVIVNENHEPETMSTMDRDH